MRDACGDFVRVNDADIAGRNRDMKIWLSAAALVALAMSLVLNGEAATVAIVVNLAIWGLLGVVVWLFGKYILARGER